MAVIGLGNWLLADEGAGLHAVELLRTRLTRENVEIAVDLVDAGTPGMNLLHQFDERDKIIFIDAGNCGLEPGQYRRFVPDDVVSIKKSDNFSLHEFDLIKFLEFARQLNPENKIDIVIYGIQAAEIKMSEELSEPVCSALPLLVEDVFIELQQGR